MVAQTVKYDFIDALRGWAILGVVLVHTNQWLPATSTALSAIAQKGSMGVQLFYITSALTLALSLHSRYKKEGSPFKSFFIRRFFRIAPLFYLAVVFYLWRDGMTPRFWAPEGLSLWHILSTVTFTNGWHPTAINSVVPGCWSIASEMGFYLLAPICFLLMSDLKKAIIGTGLFLIGGLGMTMVAKTALSPFFQQYPQELVRAFFFMWLPSQLCIFSMGFILYYVLKIIRNNKYQSRSFSFILAATSIAIMYIFSDAYGKHVFYGTAFMLFSISLMLNRLPLFINAPVCTLGKLSFSVYITHFAVISAFDHIKIDSLISTYFYGDISFAVGTICVLIATAILSKLTYELVEKNGIKLGSHIIAKLGYGSSQDSSSAKQATLTAQYQTGH